MSPWMKNNQPWGLATVASWSFSSRNFWLSPHCPFSSWHQDQPIPTRSCFSCRPAYVACNKHLHHRSLQRYLSCFLLTLGLYVQPWCALWTTGLSPYSLWWRLLATQFRAVKSIHPLQRGLSASHTRDHQPSGKIGPSSRRGQELSVKAPSACLVSECSNWHIWKLRVLGYVGKPM